MLHLYAANENKFTCYRRLKFRAGEEALAIEIKRLRLPLALGNLKEKLVLRYVGPET